MIKTVCDDFRRWSLKLSSVFLGEAAHLALEVEKISAND